MVESCSCFIIIISCSSQYITFADDHSQSSTNPQILKLGISNAENWCADSRITIEKSKEVSMKFVVGGSRNRRCDDVVYGDENADDGNSANADSDTCVRLLGIFFDAELQMNLGYLPSDSSVEALAFSATAFLVLKMFWLADYRIRPDSLLFRLSDAIAEAANGTRSFLS
jgi:hypothetical protein